MRRAVLFALTAMVLAFDAGAAAEVTYYKLPPGAGPHVVAPAPEGNVWYTAQAAGALGILDPKSGKTEQIPLGKDAAPHGVIVGPDRAAWITEGGQNSIARVDPGTKAVKLYPLPKDFADANLNTATFDHRGILWFTGQNGMYGRLDPGSGVIEAWKAPKGVGPYGITTTPKGDVWYASLAGDYIAKIDTLSGAASVVAPPRPGVRPRRIWSDSKGFLWVSFWSSGEVGRYDPMAKSWKVWKLPNLFRLLRGLCRQQGQGLAHRLHHRSYPAFRSGERGVRAFQGGLGASDARAARRSLGRRVEQGSPRRGAGLVIARCLPVQSSIAVHC
jgi:virginiamycin B lyase